jgi:hypothetical protein
MSPAIGISDFAFLTNVISKLSFIPYFEKSAWVDVLPEYDPYKYNSFPVNAGHQIYQVTRELQNTLAAESKAGKLGGMPRITIFQSLVDSTVKTADVVLNLLQLLPPAGNELILFDVNRVERLEGLIAAQPIEYRERLRNATGLPFSWVLIGNRAGDSTELAAYSRAKDQADISVEDLPLQWPQGVFSLGHVAIPFPVDDPVYGLFPASQPDGLARFELGSVVARGESGALMAPLGTFARLRCNPFFDVIRQRLVAACGQDAAIVPPAR